MASKKTITQEYLKSILDYEPETGFFRWKVRKSRNTIIGSRAGKDDFHRYSRIVIDKVEHHAHRLAFLYVYGWLPEEVDHIDVNGSRSDNRICNLRAATRSSNSCNREKQPNNKTGYKGVTWHKASQKWRAAIVFQGKQNHLGLFDTPEEAHEAYKQAALRLHGEYARF